MKKTVTSSMLEKMMPGIKDAEGWASAMNKILPKYGITTVDRIAAFISQTGHESGSYNRLVENLNYSATGLAKTWPSRFALRDIKGNILKPHRPNDLARAVERKPEEIANITYANRLGNGDQATGDGWKYRGRGLIQLTGKENYQRFANSIKLSLDKTVEYMTTKEGAIESACWFWASNSLNAIADKRDVSALTRRINGGTHGLEDRKTRFEVATKILMVA